jgi:hypothetical protein
MDTIFSLSGLTVLPFWLLIVLAPWWSGTRRIVASPLIAALPAALYAALVLPRIGEVLPVVASPSLATVAALLATPAGATIAWAHFLAFDLLAGRWIFLDAHSRGVPAWVVSPLLALTLLLGPLGFLAYLGARALPRRAGGGRRLVAVVADLLRRSWQTNRPLTVTGLLMLAVLGGAGAGLALDPRVITGAPAWLKPAKFAISLAIYAFTFVWLLSLLPGRPRLARIAAWVVTGAAVVEMAIIALQVGRGTTSHFNIGTPLDSALFSIMGGTIVLLWLATLAVGLLLLRAHLADRPMAAAVRLGIVVALAGMAVAFLMTAPTPEQRAALTARERVTTVGAHSVGVADGGPGLPVVGWSTAGGDLRVPHFVGLHALQVLPVLAWLLARRRFAWLSSGDRGLLVGVAGVAYLGLTALLTWQALRGQSVVAPDGLTLAAFGALAAAAALAAGVVVVRARRRLRAPLEPAPIAHYHQGEQSTGTLGV